MARDLFAEIGYQPETQPKASGPRDLFAEIGFDPAKVERAAPPPPPATGRGGRSANQPSRAASTPDRTPASGRSGKIVADSRDNDSTLAPIGDWLTDKIGGLNVSSDMLANARKGTFARDAGTEEGFLDRAGSLIERGGAVVDQGLYAGIASLTGSRKAREAAEALRRGTTGQEVAGQTTWEDVKANPVSGLGGYVLDTGIESVPGMVAAVTPGVGLGVLGTSMTGNIADDRARNDGRAEADTGDFLMAAPFGFGSALLERVGAKGAATAGGSTVVRRVARGAAEEGATEFAQGIIENAGGTLGTQRGFDAGEALEEGVAGAVAGAGMGGTIRAGAEVVDRSGRLVRRNPADTRTPPPGIRETAEQEAAIVTPEDEASPLDTGDIVAGRVEIAKAEAGSTADSALSAFGMPKVGTPVTIDYGDGNVEFGTMKDTFADETGSGVIIDRESGRPLREYHDTLTDAGVRITPRDAASVPEITVPVVTESVPIVPQAVPQRAAGLGTTSDILSFIVDDLEGGAKVISDSGGVTKYGISAKGNPGIDVANLTRDEAIAIYRRKYWIADLDRLDPAAAAVGLDASINHGPAFARRIIKESGGDAGRMLQMRRAEYARLAGQDPAKYGRYAKGWENRLAKLEARIGGAPAARGSVVPVSPERDVEPMELAQPDFSGIGGAPLDTPSSALVEKAAKEPSSTGLGEISDIAGAIGENLRKTLMDKIEAGDTTENGSPSPILQVAKAIKARGAAIDVPMLERISSAVDGARNSGDFQGYLKEFVNLAAPQQAAATPASSQSTEADAPTRPAESTVKAADTLAGGMPIAEAAAVARGDATPAPRSQVSVVDTGTGKSVAIMGASEAQLAAVAAAIPGARPIRRKDGATTYAKKYVDQIRAAIAGVETAGADMRGGEINEEWNRFADDSGSLGIPRAEMPQIKAEHRGAMVNFLNARGIAHREETVRADSLKPTQQEFSPSKVQKAKSFKGGSRAILVSSDGYVVDGHHQWLAARDQGEDIRIIRLDAPIRELLEAVPEFPSAETEGADQAQTPTSPKQDARAKTKAQERREPEVAPQSKPDQKENPQETATSRPVEPTDEAGNQEPGDREAPSGPIDDFGEKLVGARKDTWQSFRDRMADAKKEDVTAVPLSKSWPEPDYQQLLDNGADQYAVAAMRAMRDAIPTKPRSYGVVAWGKQVEALRDTAEKMIDGAGLAANFTEKLTTEFSRSLRDLQGAIDLYMEYGHERSFKGITFGSHHYSLYRGEKNVTKWTVEQKQKATAFSNWPRELAVADTREEALAKFRALLANGGLDKKPAVVRFDIYSRSGQPGFWIGKKVGKSTADLKWFETVKEARAFKVEHYDDLVAMLDSYKDIPPERKEVNSPRVGINHRNGADVTPDQFMETFGFRGVQFGNYVEGARRQEDLNEAYDALMDLAGVLGIPAKALSLNGTLGLAFGARGKGGKNAAMAHFEPGNIVINLTKKQGAGSLAHEWWHGLDNYFARQRGNGNFVTETTGRPAGEMRQEMADAFKAVMAAIKQTAIRERSKQLDKRRTKDYWSTDIEMSARAFESYVIAKLQDEQFSNDYLANIVSEKAWSIEGAYPYPVASEIAAIRAGFDGFFQAIESRQDGERVPLYSLPRDVDDLPLVATITSRDLGPLPKGESRLKVLRDRAMSFYARNFVGRTVTASDGKPVIFSKRAGKHAMVAKGDEILRAVPAIEALITKGRASPVPQKPGRDMVATMFAGIVEVDGERLRMGAIVREDANGRRHYDLTNAVRDWNAGDPEQTGGADPKNSLPGIEAAASASINLFRLPDGRNTETENSDGAGADLDQLKVQLEAALRKMNLSNKVVLRIVDTLGGANGSYIASLITVARDGDDTPIFTLHHEAVHALRDMGVFSPADWALLVAKAKRTPGMMRQINRRYLPLFRQQKMTGEQMEDALNEEAVADLFAMWQRGDYAAKGTIERLFQRLRGILDAIKAAFGQQRERTGDDVLREIADGTMGARAEAFTSGGARGQVRRTFGKRVKLQAAWHGTPHEWADDRADLGKIGTGEGAQSFGWGLYFAGMREIGEHYRRKLTRRTLVIPMWNGKDFTALKDEYNAGGGLWGDEEWNSIEALSRIETERTVQAAIEYQEKLVQKFPATPSYKSVLQWLQDHADEITIKEPGLLYQVDIPEDGEYLLWDKPVNEQPPHVQRALGKISDGVLKQMNDSLDESGLNPIELDDDVYKGRDLYRLLVKSELPVDTLGDNPKQDASLYLRELGIAGIKYLDGGSRSKGDGSYNYVVFDDARVKVLEKFSLPDLTQSGPFRRDQKADDAAEASLAGISRLLDGGDRGPGKVGPALEKLRVSFQDKMLPVLRLQEAVSRQLGRTTGEKMNPYLAEETMHGRIGARLDALMEDHVQPLVEAMAAANVELIDFEDYIYARHAPERNAQIAKINEAMPDGGSGMTNMEARAVMNRIERAGMTETMESLAARYDAMMAEAKQRRIDAGLLSQEEADAWDEAYEFYAPLRGRAEVEGEFDPKADARMQRSSGLSVKGKESKRAFGRRTKAADILSYAVLQAEEAIVRSEQNRVGNAFLELAKTIGDGDLLTINKVERRRRINPTTGLVEFYTVNQLTAEDAPFTISTKVDGTEHRITMNRANPQAVAIADAMRNLSAVRFELLVRTAGKLTRFFSAVNTRFSPPFIITNAIRDVMTAATTLQQYEDMPGLTRDVLRDWRKALVAGRRGNGEWAKWRREWELAGGKVAFNQMVDFEGMRERMHKDIARVRHPNDLKRVAGRFFEAVETVNDAIERAVRLSVYANARKRGVSKAKAASMSLNVTVNFTRKGQFGPAMNSAYAFFNASTQGSATLIFAAMRSKKVRRTMFGFVLLGFALDMINAMISGDDDDGEPYWDKMPEWEKSRNLILMLPGGDYIKLPLAYGLNALYGLGRNASAVGRGAQTAGEAAMGSLFEFADAFNPVGGGGTLWNIGAFTVLDPLVDVSANKDFTGRPIQPEDNPFASPETPSNNYFPTVSVPAKWLAQTLNDLTGGDEVLPGTISVSPEVLEYAFGYITGGAGRFIEDNVSLATAPLDPEAELTVNDVPMVDRLTGTYPEWLDKSLYYDRAHETRDKLDHIKDYVDLGKDDKARAYLAENPWLEDMAPIYKAAEKEMKRIRKDKREVNAAHELGELTDAQHREGMKIIKADEDNVVLQFNTAWNIVMDRQEQSNAD